MAKLSKTYYYNRNGQRKLNCYNVPITKAIVNETNITDNDELNIYAKNNKIIIEKRDKNG